MSQLTFKFPFKTSYDRQDFYVSSNNFEAYKLIESWPHWTNRFLNIYGPKGCGKTHLSIVLKNKINFFYIEALKFESKILVNLDKYEGLIIDNYNENINENLLYTALNQIFQTNK